MTSREAVEQNGFAIIPGILSPQEIDGILSNLQDATLRHSRAGVRHAFDCAAIAQFSKGSPLLGIAQETLGKSAFPFRATLFDKSSVANWLVVWHQDTALPIQERNEAIGWVFGR
jgi:hypothetical protein